MTEQKLKELLADMTLEEKVNQMDVLEVENILMSIDTFLTGRYNCVKHVSGI